jgi:hypothetical protein
VALTSILFSERGEREAPGERKISPYLWPIKGGKTPDRQK